MRRNGVLVFTEDPSVPRLEQVCGCCGSGLGKVEPDSLMYPIEWCSLPCELRWEREVGEPARARAVRQAIERAYA